MPFNTTNETLNHVEDYEGKELIGVVTNNNDPLNLGRVQASIPDLYDPQTGEVPWIGPKKDSPFGFGTSTHGPFGVYGYPQVGTKIRIELQHGDEHYPVYEPLLTAPDVNPAFAGPLLWGFRDPSGNQLRVDMAAGTWTFTHSSGDIVAYDSAGDRVTVIQGNETLNVNKQMTVLSLGNMAITSQARIDMQAPLITLNTVPVI